MHKILPVLLLCISISATAQLKKNNISRVLGTLAADSMAGRKAGSEQSDKAAAFIASEFKKTKLQTLPGAADYLQSFGMTRSEVQEASVKYDSTVVDPADILVFAATEEINWKRRCTNKYS